MMAEGRVPIFDRPVSGRETLSQLVFVLALHFVQHLDGSPPGHGQPVQTHCCSYLQPQRWPTSAHAMSRPGSDDSPGSSPLAAPEAAACDSMARVRCVQIFGYPITKARVALAAGLLVAPFFAKLIGFGV